MALAQRHTTKSSALQISLRVWFVFYRSLFAVMRPVVDLAIRLYLAQAFVMTSVESMAASHGSTGSMMSSGAMVVSNSFAGLLLSFGLFTRLSAGALLALAVAQQGGLEASEPNLFIIALLGWYIICLLYTSPSPRD